MSSKQSSYSQSKTAHQFPNDAEAIPIPIWRTAPFISTFREAYRYVDLSGKRRRDGCAAAVLVDDSDMVGW